MSRAGLSAEERAAREAAVLYGWERGLTDPEIARELGCTVGMVWRTRDRLELPCNGYPPVKERHPGERMELYKQGLGDTQIARIQGASVNAVRVWRLNHGLPSNCGVGRPRG